MDRTSKIQLGVDCRAKLLDLYDEFAEFDAHFAFFCDAMGALSQRQDDFLDRNTAEGVRLFGDWLKERSKLLKEELKVVWEVSTTG
ncbi:hypothetical protein ACXYTJ_05360 [Gilvimarinus sp. F26214L]|uniref:hypothetical protein n=1 Tax=Gilvimarinus sp. DZF01 TaxID=3461371 RepID=UPI004045F909